MCEGACVREGGWVGACVCVCVKERVGERERCKKTEGDREKKGEDTSIESALLKTRVTE